LALSWSSSSLGDSPLALAFWQAVPRTCSWAALRSVFHAVLEVGLLTVGTAIVRASETRMTQRRLPPPPSTISGGVTDRARVHGRGGRSTKACRDPRSRLMGLDEVGTLRGLKAIRRELADPAIAAHHKRIRRHALPLTSSTAPKKPRLGVVQRNTRKLGRLAINTLNSVPSPSRACRNSRRCWPPT
jgi:hypothetical protein